MPSIPLFMLALCPMNDFARILALFTYQLQMPLFQILTAGLRFNAPQNQLNRLNSPVALESSKPRAPIPADRSVFNFEFTTAASSDEEDNEKKSDWEPDVKTKRSSRLGTTKYLPPKTELTDQERFEVMKEGFLNINGKPVYHTLQSGITLPSQQRKMMQLWNNQTPFLISKAL